MLGEDGDRKSPHVVPVPPPVLARVPSMKEVDRLFPNALCYYCGDKAENVDHLVPRSKGGSNELSNKVPACSPCNSMKGSMLFDEFIARIERILKMARTKKVIQYPIQFGTVRLWRTIAA